MVLQPQRRLYDVNFSLLFLIGALGASVNPVFAQEISLSTQANDIAPRVIELRRPYWMEVSIIAQQNGLVEFVEMLDRGGQLELTARRLQYDGGAAELSEAVDISDTLVLPAEGYAFTDSGKLQDGARWVLINQSQPGSFRSPAGGTIDVCWLIDGQWEIERISNYEGHCQCFKQDGLLYALLRTRSRLVLACFDDKLNMQHVEKVNLGERTGSAQPIELELRANGQGIVVLYCPSDVPDDR